MPPTSSSRNTGLRVLGDRPWGSHFTLFYETKEDLIEIALPYLRAGLENNEFCMWVISEPVTPQEAKNALRRAVTGGRRYLDEAQIEVHSGREWYRTGNLLDVEKVAAAWDAKLADAIAHGRDGMRVAASAVKLTVDEWKKFSDYEERLNHFVADKSMLVLCAYALGDLRVAEILDVARTHPLAVVKRSGRWEIR
jgi:hypothetical protein